MQRYIDPIGWTLFVLAALLFAVASLGRRRT